MSLSPTDQAQSGKTNFLSNIGALRTMLAILVIVCVGLVFFSQTEAVGWGRIPSQVTPALVVLLAWVLAFDLLMARVLMSDQNDAVRRRYRSVIKLDLILLAALLLFWGPFFITILSP